MLMNISGIRYEHFSEKDYNTARELLSYDVDAVFITAFIEEDFQELGIGRKFVMYLCNEIYQRGSASVDLWCVVGNYARNLYDSLGLTPPVFPCYKLSIYTSFGGVE